MVDIERNFYRKSSKGINLFNNLFKKRSKRNLNEMVKCLSSNNSNDKLDQLLSKSLNNVNELNNADKDEINSQNSKELDNLKEIKFKNQNLNYDETIKRRLSTPIIIPHNNVKEPCKKLSLKTRRSFSPRSKLIINQNNKKKLSLDQVLSEHYNQLSTECSSSYMSLVSNSPISPRIKSIDEDIENLTLSRQDNPFIQSKLEKLSSYTGIDYDILSISNLSLNNGHLVSSTNTLNKTNQSNNSTHTNQFNQSNKASSISSEELDEIFNFNNKSNKDENNLHQYLVRSPPPDFPLHFSEFVFPPIGSPLRSLSMKYNNSTINSNDTSIKTPNFLSPLKQSKNWSSSNQSPKINSTNKNQNLFFTNLNKSNKFKSLAKSNDSQLSRNENDVELIITS